jgi:uncharacterized protein YacL
MVVVVSSRETTEAETAGGVGARTPADRRRARAERARGPLGRLFRYAGLSIGALLGWSFGGFFAARPELVAVTQFFLASVLAALGFLVTPYLLFDLSDAIWARLRALTVDALIAGGIGAFAGGVFGLLLAWPLALLPRPAGQLIPPTVALLAMLVGAALVSSRRRELMEVMGLRSQRPGLALVLDTSALIDGRIGEFVRLAVPDAQLLVPEEVLRELHRLAEHSDPPRRARGRRGLELLRRLREEVGSQFVVVPARVPETEADDAVVACCRECAGRLVTCDQRLADVARVQGLVVWNPHQLAEALRSPVHVGDRFVLHLSGPGREPEQAIGYLDDGTLVVVEEARSRIGQDVPVEVTRILRTPAGRLVFAQLVAQSEP